MDVIIGITGASGVEYGVNLLETLSQMQNVHINIHLIISENAKKLLKFETKSTLDELNLTANNYYDNSDLGASIASGSKMIECMIIIPCSMSTAAKINTGITDNLITRAADVCIKEHRKLIIVPRETPLNSTHLKNLLELSQKGVLVLPAMPAFYHRPAELNDLITFITGKILDSMGITHELYARWSGDER